MIRIFTLIFLLLNYQALITQTRVSKQIRLLLLVFLVDLGMRIEPEFILTLFGQTLYVSISIGIMLAQVLLLSICYLRNQRQIFVNHYIFLTFLGLIALAAIGFVLTQIQGFQLLQLVACGGAAVFGLLNTQYKKQQQ
jgi:hypothetical protein